MNVRLTAKELRRLGIDDAGLIHIIPKHRNQRTLFNGRHYPSKLQAQCAQWLQLRKDFKEIDFYLEEVPFRLPGGATHRLDFMVVTRGLPNEYIEAKGRDLALGKMKRRMVEELYGIRIRVWTNEDAKRFVR